MVLIFLGHKSSVTFAWKLYLYNFFIKPLLKVRYDLIIRTLENQCTGKSVTIKRFFVNKFTLVHCKYAHVSSYTTIDFRNFLILLNICEKWLRGHNVVIYWNSKIKHWKLNLYQFWRMLLRKQIGLVHSIDSN